MPLLHKLGIDQKLRHASFISHEYLLNSIHSLSIYEQLLSPPAPGSQGINREHDRILPLQSLYSNGNYIIVNKRYHKEKAGLGEVAFACGFHPHKGIWEVHRIKQEKMKMAKKEFRDRVLACCVQGCRFNPLTCTQDGETFLFIQAVWAILAIVWYSSNQEY